MKNNLIKYFEHCNICGNKTIKVKSKNNSYECKKCDVTLILFGDDFILDGFIKKGIVCYINKNNLTIGMIDNINYSIIFETNSILESFEICKPTIRKIKENLIFI